MLVSTEHFRVNAINTSLHNRLTIPSLAGFMQEAAYKNVEENGLPGQSLMAQGMAWVLLKIQVQVNQLPGHREGLRLTTYPAGSERFFFYRDYIFEDGAGNHCGQASSMWVLIDLQSRKPCKVPEQVLPLARSAVEAPLPRPGKITLPGFKTPAASFTARWLDMDVNRHTNNSVYFRWIEEAMPEQVLQTCTIGQVAIAFKEECLLNDEVEVYCEPVSGLSFAHLLKRKADGREVARASSQWQKLQPEP